MREFWGEISPDLTYADRMRPLAAILILATAPLVGALTVDEQRQVDRYTEILREDPTHTLARQRTFQIYRDAGEVSTLLADTASRSTNSLPDALLHGYVLLESGDPSAALTAFVAATEQFPADPSPLLAQAVALRALDRDPLPALEAALAIAPNRTDLLDEIATARLAANDAPGAIAVWEQSLATNPDNPALHRAVADALIAADQFEAAQPRLQWLAENGDPAQRLAALRDLSDLAERSGDLSAAIEYADQAAARLGPTHWLRPALTDRITGLRARAGTLTAHLATLRTTAAANPRDWRTWQEISNVETTLGHTDRALEALDQAVAADPTDPARRRELARAEADFGDLARATELADALIAERPHDPDAAFLRAELDVRADRLDDARHRIESLLATDPSQLTRATQFFEEYRLADAARGLWEITARQGDAEASLKLAESQLAANELPPALATLRAATLNAEQSLRAASLLRSHDHPNEAIPFLEAAVKLDPANLEAVQRLAATLVATNRFDDAATVLEDALPVHASDSATLDRQLYDTLTGIPPVVGQPDPVQTKLDQLAADPGATERLARWQRWHEQPDADPAPITAERLIPDAATLDELAAAANDAPDSVQALIDLAAARQSANDYYAALEAWTQAFDLAAPAARPELLPPILAVTQRLRLPARGLEFLTAHALSRPTEPARIQAWIDAVEFAAANDQLPALELALAAAPDEYPTHVARAALQTTRGHVDAAFETLETHTRLAADQADARSRVLEAAAHTSNQAGVVRSAMAVIANSDDFPSWQIAADALEAAGADQPAESAWAAIRRRFGRDPAALAAVAAHHERSGNADAAAEAIFAAARLDPTDPIALAKAADLADRRGDRDLATSLNYQILATTKPISADPHRYPGDDEITADLTATAHSIAMRAVGGLADPANVATVRSVRQATPASAEDAIRLTAIRALARLATGGTARETWLAWCANATPYEAAWGTYEAGDFPAAHAALLADLASGEDPGPVERALVWNALRRGSFDTLRAWINSDPLVRRRRTEALFLGLSRLLAARSADLAPAFIDALFPEESTADVERWRAAWLLAAHADLANAIRLAREAGPYPTEQQTAEAQLASWHLLLGQREDALASLATTDSAAPLALTDPEFAALRLRWLLLPEAERATLNRPTPLDRPARDALLAALAGEEDLTASAEHLVNHWRDRSASGEAAPRFIDLVSGGVDQLLTWNLPSLALSICEAARENEPLVAQQSGDARAWRASLASLTANARLRLAAPREVPALVADLDPHDFNFQITANLARSLDAAGYSAAALALSEELLRRQPTDLAAINLRGISAALVHDTPLQASLLEDSLTSGRLGSNFDAIVAQTEQLAALQFQLNDPAAALPFIERVLQLAPANSRLVELNDLALEKLGDTDQRHELWKSLAALDPAAGLLGYASFLLEIDRPDEALTLLRPLLATHPPNSALVRDLLYQTEASHGDRDAAIAELHHLAADDQWEPAISLAIVLDRHGATAPARSVLRHGLGTAPTTRARFACGRALIDLQAARLPDLDGLRAAASDDPALVAELFEAGAAYAAESPEARDWFAGQMRDEWRDGAGPTLAGRQLLTLAIADHDSAAITSLLDAYLAPAHYDQAIWIELADFLARSDHPAQAARVYGRLADRQPDQPGYVFREALQLWLAGDRSAAITRVTPWIEIRDFDPSLQLQAADFFRDIDRPRRAAELYAEIVADDIAVRRPEAWIALAALRRDAGDFDSAKLYLLAAFQNPTVQDTTPISAFLIARGGLTSLDPDDNEFRLRSDRWRAVQSAIAATLVDRGHYERALAWITPGSLPDEKIASLLQQIASRGDLYDQVASLWQTALAERPASAQLTNEHEAFLAKRD